MIIFLLSLNFIVAKEVNETDLDLKTSDLNYDNSISIDNIKSQDTTNLNNNQPNNSLDNTNKSTEITSKGNNDQFSSVNELKHIYVSPTGDGDGLSISTPGNLVSQLSNVEDNTIIHVLNGTYSISSSDNIITIANKNNITITANNPDNVIINASVSADKKYVFNLNSNTNLKFENITFTNYGGTSTIMRYFSFDQGGDYIFENCNIINITKATYVFSFLKENITINNTKFINIAISDYGVFYPRKNGMSNIVLNNSEFINNKLPAIVAKNENNNKFFINNCEFINNTHYVINDQSTNSDFIFNNCKFINNAKNRALIIFSHGAVINNCYFSDNFKDIYPRINTCSVLINNSVFNKNNTEININNPDSFIRVYGNVSIINSNFTSLLNHTILAYLEAGSLDVFENNTLDHPYAFTYIGQNNEKGTATFPQLHATLTFLNGEGDKVLAINSNVLINATLVDDYGNSIIIPGIKFNVFGQTYTLSYSNGAYERMITTLNETTTSNIDVDEDVLNNYPFDYNIIVPDSIVLRSAHNVTLNTSDISYGENATVNITVSSVDSGNISYTVKSGNNIIKEEVNKEFSNNSVSIVLDNLDVGTYTVTATVLATEEYGETTVSRTFTVNRVTPNISVIVNNVTTLDNVTVNVTVPEGVTGQILIQIGEVYAGGGAANRIVDDKTVQVKSGDSVIITYAPFAAKDTYALGWSFTSNNPNYNSVSNNNWNTGEGLSKLIKFEVVKADSNLTVKADDVDWGNDVFVSITTDSRFTGNITVKLGDDEKIAEIKDGSGNVSFANLKADTYNVTAKFNETDLFIASQKDINVTVNKVNSTLTLDDIVFDWNKTGSTTVSYSGATNVEAVIVETGTSIPIQDNTITVSNLKAGNYTLRVTTVPDENHTGVTKDVNIKVNKVNSTLTLGDDIIFNYGESGSTTVSYEDATSVVAEVVDNTANIKIENGNITVSGLDASNYTLKVTTQVDENHTSISKTVNIKVNKVDSDINILNPVNYVYGNVGQCSVFSQGVINFTAVIVDHPEANITIDNGIVNVSGLKVGNYTLRVTANPDRNHNSVFRECNVTVNMAEVPADQALNITAPADSQSPTFSINLDSSAEGNFTVYVDGKEWSTVKVVNGSASITVANLPAGNHNITISYSGDDNHAAIVQNTTLSISKIATGISASKVTAVYLTSKKLVVTLKDKAGNILTGMEVTVKVGSISKTLTTDSKGQVSVDVSKLVPKTYTAKFTFAGDDKYLKSEGSASVKINKAASKITAKKKTFKAKKKTKKYTITLKSGKKAIGKVKVTIKVGKKTYTAKTNKKGKATFNLKKLTKKGKYNAVIKFKGNKYYKATTKKVKIVLK